MVRNIPLPGHDNTYPELRKRDGSASQSRMEMKVGVKRNWPLLGGELSGYTFDLLDTVSALGEQSPGQASVVSARAGECRLGYKPVVGSHALHSAVKP